MVYEAKTRVMIVDDHKAFRDNLKRLILTLDDFEVVGEAGRMAAGLDGVLWLVPDLVTVDISLPDRNGIFLTRKIKQLHPKIHVLVITVHSSRACIEEALRAGADGYLLKTSAADQALPALKRVAEGRFYVDAALPSEWMSPSWSPAAAAPAREGDQPDALETKEVGCPPARISKKGEIPKRPALPKTGCDPVQLDQLLKEM